MQGEPEYKKRRRNQQAVLRAELDQITAGIEDQFGPELARLFQESDEAVIDLLGFMEIDPDFLRSVF